MQIVFLAIVFFIAGIVPELTGFGVATVSMSLLPFILPLEIVIPLVAIISVIAAGIVAFQTKSRHVLKHIAPLIAGSLTGVVVGMLFLNVIEINTLSIILGVFLVSYAFYGMFVREHFLPTGSKFGAIIGFFAGFFSSTFNIHGPLVGVYSSSDEKLSKVELKDMIATYMFIAGIFTVSGHALFGRVTMEVLGYLAVSLPFLVLGLVAGTKFFNKINAKFVKYGTYLFVFIAGVTLLFFK